MLVLEPSCASVFRDELRKLLPHDEHARRLGAQTVVLDELLDRYAPDWSPANVGRRALVHGHCHQKAVIAASGARTLLTRAGVEAEMTEAGCCGMAGSFGYDAGEQYERLDADRRAVPAAAVQGRRRRTRCWSRTVSRAGPRSPPGPAGARFTPPRRWHWGCNRLHND